MPGNKCQLMHRFTVPDIAFNIYIQADAFNRMIIVCLLPCKELT